MVDFKEISSLENFDTETYFASLISIARADGNIDNVEMGFIEDQAKLMGFDLEAACEKERSLAQIDFSKTSALTKNTLLRDCISLAYIDGNYDGSEKKKIHDLGKKMGVSSDKISEIEKWLVDYWTLIEKGQAIMSE